MSKYIVGEAKYYSELNQPLYELQSVAVHMGTIHGGHYISYAKKEDN
jgi:ubiquitin C-terminal hydrolase